MLSAREIAIAAHGDQRYGNDPYEIHLTEVVSILFEYGYGQLALINSAWLHDTVEDTDLTIEVIEQEFGKLVATIVQACTGTGANRKERNASILKNIEGFQEAAIVKTADRIANAEKAKRINLDLYKMYMREMDQLIEVVTPLIKPLMLERLKAI